MLPTKKKNCCLKAVVGKKKKCLGTLQEASSRSLAATAFRVFSSSYEESDIFCKKKKGGRKADDPPVRLTYRHADTEKRVPLSHE